MKSSSTIEKHSITNKSFYEEAKITNENIREDPFIGDNKDQDSDPFIDDNKVQNSDDNDNLRTFLLKNREIINKNNNLVN